MLGFDLVGDDVRLEHADDFLLNHWGLYLQLLSSAKV